MNDAVYLVVENSSGELLDALNLEIAENSFYILTKADGEGISKDEKVYRVKLPIKTKIFPAIFMSDSNLEMMRKNYLKISY